MGKQYSLLESTATASPQSQVFVPFARKFTGIRPLQRIGVGLVLSSIAMLVSGAVEARRKSVAIEHNVVDPTEPLPMSVFWLWFPYMLYLEQWISSLWWGC